MSNPTAEKSLLDFSLENLRNLIKGGFPITIVLTDDTKSAIEKLRTFFEAKGGVTEEMRDVKHHRQYMGIEWRGKEGMWTSDPAGGEFTLDKTVESVGQFVKFIKSNVPSHKRYDADAHCIILDAALVMKKPDECDNYHEAMIKPAIESLALENEHDEILVRKMFILVGQSVSIDESIKDFVMVLDDRKEKVKATPQSFEDFFEKTYGQFLSNVAKIKVDMDVCRAAYHKMSKRSFGHMLIYMAVSKTDINQQSVENYQNSIQKMQDSILFSA